VRAIPAVLLVVALLAAPAPAYAHVDGWRLVLSTDFDGAALPGGCTAHEGPHGDSGATFFKPDEVGVAGGLLRLGVRRQTTAGRPFTAGGVACRGLTQVYGRYEFRARPPLGAGLDAYATLWPADGSAQATLIEAFCRPGAETVSLTHQYGQSETTRVVSGSYSADFHSYVVEWTPSRLRIVIDDQVGLDDEHVSTVPGWIAFGVSADGMAAQPDAPARLPAQFEIDSLRIYAYEPAPSAPVSSRAPVVSGPMGPVVGPSDADLTRGLGLPREPGPRRERRVWWTALAVLGLLLLVGGLATGYVRWRQHQADSALRP
jgi:hypothetical protein